MTPLRAFRSAVFGTNSAGARSLGKPAAVYPAAIATDSNLIIAVDRQQTQLAAPMSATDTSMTVADPTQISAYNLLSIDNEIVKTTGPPAGNVVPISRGFDGTAAALHLANATVAGLIDAYHHNALVAEIEAIETTLGANLSRLPAVPFIIAGNYNFPAQSPGGSLSVGNNVVTLSPVPQGVNGTDVAHYLYISGGTGAAEAVLITGGTAVSGAPSGTVIVNCANAHTGAWTIGSATGGFSEAIAYAPPYNTVWFTGRINTYATITIPSFIAVRGFGRSSVLQPQGGFDCLFYNGPASFDGDLYWGINDLSIAGTGTPASGSGIHLLNKGNGTVHNVQIYGTFHGLIHEACALVNVSDLQVASYGFGIWFKQAGNWSGQYANISIDQLVSTSGCACIRLEPGCTGLEFSNFLLQRGYITVDIEGSGPGPFNEIKFSTGFFDNYGNVGVNIYITGTASATNTVSITDVRVAGGGTGGYGILSQSNTAINNVSLHGVKIIADNGIVIKGGAGWSLRDCMVSPVNPGGNALMIAQSAGAQNVGPMLIDGCTFGYATDNLASSGSVSQYGIATDANAHSNIQVRNCSIFGSTAPLLWNTTGSGNIFTNNVGIDDKFPAIASAASIAAPINPTFLVTGTTTVTTITGAVAGQRKRLIKTDAGSLTIGGGGNIPGAHTLAQNGALDLVYDGVNWW